MSSFNIQPVRGTKDLFGDEIIKYNKIIEIAKANAFSFNFEELQTPIFEFSEIYERNLGETSDIIAKEVYKFKDRSDHNLTLRPEFTAGVVRSLISNGELQQVLPRKFFSYGPIFRYDRPQKGRQRQFHQINYEIFGEDSWYCDVEILLLAQQLLKNLNLQQKVTLNINSLGCQETKKNYTTALSEYFNFHHNDLSEDSKKRLETNPLRILDSKDQNDIALINQAPIIADYYSPLALERFDKIISLLTKFSFNFTVNYRLVRGLDYYTSTVFEYVMEHEGAQNAVLAGGRYDNLVYDMSQKNISAIGFAAGVERLMMLSENVKNSQDDDRAVIVSYISENEKDLAFNLVNRLRINGFKADFIFEGNFKKQMKRASQINAKYVIIIGENEVKNSELIVKNFDNSQEYKVKQDLIIHYLQGKKS